MDQTKGRSSFGAAGMPSYPADRKGLNVARRSTPDSEALASSDEDHDHLQSSTHSAPGANLPKPARRGSWLSEVQTQQRKYSLGAPLTTTTSQPNTPSGEFAPWASASRANNSNGAFSTNVSWNKDPPSRLTEVPRSPASSVNNSHPVDDNPLSPLTNQHSDSDFPFPIPLTPIRKAVRSQSYSVGQMDQQDIKAKNMAPVGTMMPRIMQTSSTTSQLLRRNNRTNVDLQYQHRPLGLLLEDEDDQSSINSSYHSNRVPFSITTNTEPIGNSSISTDTLRQLAMKNSRTPTGPFGRVLESSSSAVNTYEYAVDESDDPGSRDRAHWTSSQGFGHLDTGLQSRRHSLANVEVHRTQPTSMAPTADYLGARSSLHNALTFTDAPAYFTGAMTLERERERAAMSMAAGPSTVPATSQFQGGYHSGSQFPAPMSTAGPSRAHASSQAPSYEPNPFAVPNMSLIQRPTRTLYVVAFKCHRNDIYHLPANTGLQVTLGQMVIVEGDRGMDMGQVTAAGVGMEEAKLLKEQGARQHFDNLILFSRFNQAANGSAIQEGTLAADQGASYSSSSAIGGMGPALAMVAPGPVQLDTIEFKPKLIKRLAQSHEVHKLLDKEGHEARAKRLAQGECNKHSLPMEILDAEFQYDQKKLTFYYYAETYINFNDLVTDLFKLYKTRIWMSAVNPAALPIPAPGPGPATPSIAALAGLHHAGRTQPSIDDPARLAAEQELSRQATIARGHAVDGLYGVAMIGQEAPQQGSGYYPFASGSSAALPSRGYGRNQMSRPAPPPPIYRGLAALGAAVEPPRRADVWREAFAHPAPPAQNEMKGMEYGMSMLGMKPRGG